MKSISGIYLGIFLALQGCAPDEPLVVDHAGTALPYNIVVASGNRDGYYLNAKLGLFPPDLITGLQMQLIIEIAVVPKLLEGTWNMGSDMGSVSAERLKFFGGQGGSPIIAGRFLLHAAEPENGINYIVNLPNTEIKREGLEFQRW